jgi:Mg-chelatase subunit ChlI
MTGTREAISLAATYDRVAAHLVGRERELTLALAAVAAGRDLILEGPPGTSKSTLLRAITAEWGIPLVFVEGNADLTPAKLIGHHNPARVLREDYSPDNFVDGPLLQAMREGGFLYIEEFNRAPEDTLNTLLTAMAERQVTVPTAGTVVAAPTFRVLASMNPYDNVGTTRLSTSVHDRICRLAIGYQDAAAERGIVALRAPLTEVAPDLYDRLVGDAVAGGWHVVAVDWCADDTALPYRLGSRGELDRVVADACAAVAAAGVIAGGVPAWQLLLEQHHAVLDINPGGVLTLAQVAVPAMLRRPVPRHGRFLAVASAAATRGMPVDGGLAL